MHAYLAAHPEIVMSELKEVNFFFGRDTAPDGPEDTWWRQGQWHRGPDGLSAIRRGHQIALSSEGQDVRQAAEITHPKRGTPLWMSQCG